MVSPVISDPDFHPLREELKKISPLLSWTVMKNSLAKFFVEKTGLPESYLASDVTDDDKLQVNQAVETAQGIDQTNLAMSMMAYDGASYLEYVNEPIFEERGDNFDPLSLAFRSGLIVTHLKSSLEGYAAAADGILYPDLWADKNEASIDIHEWTMLLRNLLPRTVISSLISYYNRQEMPFRPEIRAEIENIMHDAVTLEEALQTGSKVVFFKTTKTVAQSIEA